MARAASPLLRLTTLAALVALLLINMTRDADNPERDRAIFADPRTRQFTLTATDTQRRYRILVDLPAEPPSSPAGYPTLYVLDGNYAFAMAARARRQHDTKALIVAIGYEPDEPTPWQARTLDLTPPALADPTLLARERSTRETGGADPFLRFITHDLQPHIRAHFPTDPRRETLFGHSLAGLFTLHVLLTAPDTAANYVIVSPSIWWDDRSILTTLARRQAASPGHPAPKRVLVSVGLRDNPEMIADAHRLATTLNACYAPAPGEDHMSVIPNLLATSIRFALSPERCGGI